jgi:hypothetical protein
MLHSQGETGLQCRSRKTLRTWTVLARPGTLP